MIQGAGKAGSVQVQNAPVTTGVSPASYGSMNSQKDAKESSTDAKFGEVWNQIQTKYGARPEKAREIKKTLGKDDFLKLMITQMKHQDPTKPFEADKLGSEMAQFTSVEQLQNLNQAMSRMANQNQPLERLAMTNLIGKTITVDRERFPHTEGTPDSLSFALPRDASQVHVAVVDQAGDVLIEKDLGPQKKGEGTFTWDGIKGNTLPAKSGTYQLRVEAKDDKGVAMQTSRNGAVQVVGVSFEGTEPVLLVGDANRPDKVLMKNVIRIVDGGGPGLIPGAQMLSDVASQQRAQAPAAAPSTPEAPTAEGQKNYFTFQKGVGSENLDTSRLTPDVQAALAQYQQQAQEAAQAKQAAESQSSQPPQPSERGFPNGLGEAPQAAPAQREVAVATSDAPKIPANVTIQKGGMNR